MEIGQIIDSKYRIVRMLGEGGMGAVYEGENVRIHHRVAIKVLHPDIATRGDVLERFEHEAQAAGKIGSDHIVEVYDLGELPDGARYMVMEYLDGENLASRVKDKGRLAAPAIAPILMQLLDGLGAAHAAGIVHRDLKPDNIFLVRDKKTGKDFVKIVDFGVSKFNKTDAGMSMTRTGVVIGTPYYMSPEQAKGAKNTDHRSDLYAIGVVLYECATGQVPFQADTFNELMFKIVLETPKDPETLAEGLDPHFAAIIKKAMAREPEGRYQSAVEFQEALSAWMNEADGGTGVFSVGPARTLVRPQSTSEEYISSPTVPAPAGSAKPLPVPPLSNTAGSLPNVAATYAGGAAASADKKKRPVGLIAGIAVGIGALAAVIGVMALRPSSPSAAAGPAVPADLGNHAVGTAAPNVAAPPSPPALVATATPSASASAAPSAAPMAVASAVEAPEAPAHVAASEPHHHLAGSKASTPPAASSNASTQVKGRVIRTDL